MSDLFKSHNLLPDEALLHYEDGREQERLLNSVGQLELARTQELLSRHLPRPVHQQGLLVHLESQVNLQD